MDFNKKEIDGQAVAAFLTELAGRIRSGEVTVEKASAEEENTYPLGDDFEPIIKGWQGDFIGSVKLKYKGKRQ